MFMCLTYSTTTLFQHHSFFSLKWIPLGPSPYYSRLSFYTWKIAKSMKKKFQAWTALEPRACFASWPRKPRDILRPRSQTCRLIEVNMHGRHWKNSCRIWSTDCFLGAQTREHLLRKQNCFWKKWETFFLTGKQIFLPQQMFPGAANGETLASAALFPRLRRP